jgi:hypothetical protein
MGNFKKASSVISLLFMTGCIGNTANLFENNLSNDTTTQALIFKTNEHSFMHSLKHVKSTDTRNNYLDEFLLKSDMQCANYLNKPLTKKDTKKNDSLYMNIFDTASTLFGIKYITDTAKAVFLSDDGTSIEEKEAYANALSPEIRKGVEIGRARYAKEMIKKKSLKLKEYSAQDLKRDTLIYDKQCDDSYGLIEINRALKEMQTAVNTRTITKEPTLSIDPQSIKKKVTEVTKEVKKKKINKKEIKKEEENLTVLSV